MLDELSRLGLRVRAAQRFSTRWRAGPRDERPQDVSRLETVWPTPPEPEIVLPVSGSRMSIRAVVRFAIGSSASRLIAKRSRHGGHWPDLQTGFALQALREDLRGDQGGKLLTGRRFHGTPSFAATCAPSEVLRVEVWSRKPNESVGVAASRRWTSIRGPSPWRAR
jgi:hypothetical protein